MLNSLYIVVIANSREALSKVINRIALTLVAFVLATMTSCVKETHYLTDDAVCLTFSSDTVMFDTVFATMGSTTHQVRVYNNYDSPILINTVSLRGGSSSRYRINVDGDTSLVARDVEIAAHDSIFVFIQVNIDPGNQLSPWLVEDAIVFGFNGKRQELPLMAYGRNAVYHTPTSRVYTTYRNGSGGVDTVWFPYSIIDCDNWDHSLPHVILGYAVVNSNQTLHLFAGDELYFGTDSYLWVYDSASLDVRGSLQQPVLFTSLRHDGWYDTLPGQWGYIWLSAGSKNNHIEYARIDNGTVGILVDTNVNTNPTLQIYNSVIENHSTAGIVGQGAYIVGDNILVDNCGVALLSLQYGGRYRFSNSTFANYWRYSSRTAPALILNNYYRYSSSMIFPRPLVEATFLNCIVYGNYSGRDNSGEIMFDAIETATFNYSFDHCLLRSSLIDSVEAPSLGLILNRDPLFIDPRGHNYHLGEGSPAINAGSPLWLISGTDIEGNPRSSTPSIGAFERVGDQ